MLAALATLYYVHAPALALFLFQEGEISWDPISLWKQMGILAKIVVVILFIMSGWSIGVMIDRWMAFSAARKQSRAFAPAVAGALRDGKIEEAIKVAERDRAAAVADADPVARGAGGGGADRADVEQLQVRLVDEILGQDGRGPALDDGGLLKVRAEETPGGELAVGNPVARPRGLAATFTLSHFARPRFTTNVWVTTKSHVTIEPPF